jgi:hypothetical protein|tara:strand:+ start:7214 stop:7648 length:435 start_codon:yes stop_codon:yes gene_type:complete
MDIETLRAMANADIKIDETDLHSESLKTPQLHNKYLIMHENSKLEMEKLVFTEKIMKRDKWLYYSGKMGEDDLKRHNWDPFPYTILKTDIPMFIDADIDIQKLRAKVALQTSVASYLEQVIKIIIGRQWNIKSAIEWIKFTQGV